MTCEFEPLHRWFHDCDGRLWMNGCQLLIGDRAVTDFGECVASRSTGTPTKRTSTVSVPHMSGFWDFSKVTGELSYESREVTYSIQLMGEDRSDLQRRKSDVMSWLLEVHDEEIRDEDLSGWHFVGSCSGCEWEEAEDGETGTITATFLCQPFLVADDETEVWFGNTVTEVVVDNPGVSTEVYARVIGDDKTATITIGGLKQTVSSTEPTRLVARMPHGRTTVGVSVTVSSGGVVPELPEAACISFTEKRI